MIALAIVLSMKHANRPRVLVPKESSGAHQGGVEGFPFLQCHYASPASCQAMNVFEREPNREFLAVSATMCVESKSEVVET